MTRLGCALAVAVLAAAPVGAQPSPNASRADELFQRGKALMAEGKYAEACRAFDESQQQDPAIATVMNQADCREKNGQLATARALFLEAARQADSAGGAAARQLASVARKRAAQLEPRVSTLQLVVPDVSRVAELVITRDGEVIPKTAYGTSLPVDGGTYAIVAKASGRRNWQRFVTVAAERDVVVVTIPPLARQGVTAADEPVEGASAAGGGSIRPALAIGATGLGLAAIGGGSVLGILAKRAERDAATLCPDPMQPCLEAKRATELSRTGHRRALYANIAFAAGGALLVTAAVVWWTSRGDDRGGQRSSVALVPDAALGHGGLSIVGEF